MLIPFCLGFRKMAKVCMMKSWLEWFFLCADLFRMGFLLFWRSIILTVSVSVIASGIDVIFFLSENTIMQTEFCEYVHFINTAFHCTFKVSNTKADK